jgi:hypothetical protein
MHIHRVARRLVGAAIALSLAASAQAQSLKAQYHTTATSPTGNQLQPLMSLVNTGTTTVTLSTVTVRYWFTKDGTQALSSWCDYTPRGCANLTQSFVAVSPAVATADTYLQLAFGAGAGTLAPGQSTGDIQIRVAKSDWSNFNQANDWSFDATKGSAAADWSNVTVYVNGALAWGTEPVTGVVDTTPPTVSLAVNPSGTVTAATTITLTATATDNVGVTKVEIYDGTVLLASKTAAPYTFTVSYTSSASNGTHTFSAKAYDAAGNVGTSTSPILVPVNIPPPDTTAPVVSLASSATTVTAATTITLTATATDNVGVARVEFYQGTSLIGTKTASPYTQTVQIACPLSGTPTYTAKAYDAAGNAAISAAVNVVVNFACIDPPPTISLTSSATSVTTASTITLTASASDDVGVTKVEFYDGAVLLGTKTAAPYTQPVAFTSANNGTHGFTAKAYDTANQTATTSAVNVVVNIDATPPAVTLASSATTATTGTSITLTASATDNVGVAKVEFYEGSTLLGTDTTAPYTQGVALSTSFVGTRSFTARAYDAAGNSATSTAVSVVVSDITPPAISIASSATTVTAASTITLTAAPSDNVSVTKVEFWDGTTLRTQVLGPPWTTTVSLTSANNGMHSFTAKAFDAAGNTATSAAVNVAVNIPTVDTTPPTVSIASSATSVTSATTITLTATAADNVGVTRVEFYDGTTFRTQVVTSPWTTTVSLTSANNGTHTFTAKAYDAAGNVGTSAAVTVVVNIPTDLVPPTCSLTSSATSVTTASTITLTANATDNVGVVKVEFYDGQTLFATQTNGNPVPKYPQPVALTSVNNGTHSFTCKAYDNANSTGTSAAVVVTVNIPPPANADVTLTVDTSASRRAISPYVYGYNASRLSDAPPGATYTRIGGNRWTAYNWTNNASNAGSDWGPYANDTYMGTPTQGAGYAIAPTINDAKASGIAALVTIPIQGWVSQAKSGNVPLTDPVTSWFVPNVPAKGSAFTLSPSPSSTTVYQDELANFIGSVWGSGATPHVSLDNEPDLWGYVSNGAGTGTHPEVQRTQLTYSAFLQQSIASASAIKAALPSSLVYGPVSYGWNGMLSFQGAPDSTGATIDNSFIDYYLSQMSAASTSRRLLDVLDLHWYSEATCSSSGVRVINTDNSDCVVAARVQAPRSLFDSTYVETSWITQWTTASSSMGAGIQLLPRFQAKIAAKFPGTKLALTEYNHGGEDHVSGAVAEADTLGIFGREGVYAAAFWSVNSNHAWTYAAWKAFRNYDGAGHNFGDTSVSASTSDVSHVSVYASVDAANANRMVLVIVHRPTLSSSGTLDLNARTVQLNWTHSATLRTARAWQLTNGGSPTWQTLSVPAPTSNSITLTLPALSVTTVELTP